MSIVNFFLLHRPPLVPCLAWWGWHWINSWNVSFLLQIFQILNCWVCAVVWWWWVGAARILHSYISAVKNWNGITLLLKYWLTRKVSFQFLNHQSCCFFQGKLKFVDSSVSQEYYSIQCHCSILKFCKFFLHFWANICLLQIFHFPIFPSWLCRSLQKCFLFTFSGFKYFLNRSDQTETMS